MPDIKFRWPEEETQHVEPKYSYAQKKNDDYIEKLFSVPTGMKTMNHNQFY